VKYSFTFAPSFNSLHFKKIKQITMSKPQIVLIPGAWHTPAAFSVLTERLESHGYTVHSTQLPSVGSDDNPPEDLSRDIAALQAIVTKAIGDGNDVMVVPHSWSGIVAGSGLVGYGKKQREEKGLKGGVVKGAYMCSFLVPEGVSLMDAIQHQIPDWWEVKVSLHGFPILLFGQGLLIVDGLGRPHIRKGPQHLLQRSPRLRTTKVHVSGQIA
jgi:pimeloyl-ACP methyl ester carboxylesterase